MQKPEQTGRERLRGPLCVSHSPLGKTGLPLDYCAKGRAILESDNLITVGGAAWTQISQLYLFILLISKPKPKTQSKGKFIQFQRSGINFFLNQI